MMFYESLTVYQKTFSVNKKIYRLLKNNKTIPSYMKNQLGRASLSIMLNIAEGTAKSSAKDRKNFYTTARASAFETTSLIKFLVSENEIKNELGEEIYFF
jgi:four helix bundle protein